MAKTSVKAENCISALNQSRKAFMWGDKPFSKASFKTMWQSCGLPWSEQVINACIKYSLITRVKKGLYKFCTLTDEYVHVSRLENILSYIRKIRNEYNNKSKTYEVNEKSEPVVDKIAEAIKLLKENGYRVSKPVITYEEV